MFLHQPHHHLLLTNEPVVACWLNWAKHIMTIKCITSHIGLCQRSTFCAFAQLPRCYSASSMWTQHIRFMSLDHSGLVSFAFSLLPPSWSVLTPSVCISVCPSCLPLDPLLSCLPSGHTHSFLSWIRSFVNNASVKLSALLSWSL